MNRHHASVLCLLVGFFIMGAGARAQTHTVLLSANSVGVEGNQNSSSPSISADGRLVAFVSRAGNLVPADSNTVDDIFLRNLEAGTITRISVSTGGAQGDKPSTRPSMSADGRYVVFLSDATTLVAGKGRGIYLRDTQANATTYVASALDAVISGDGSTIVVVTADALLPADTNLVADVYAIDRATGSASLVSVASDGTLGDKASGIGGVAVSTDGSVIAFESVALNLVAGTSNIGGDIYVRDRNANTTERASVTFAGLQANKGSAAPSISGDGNLVAWESTATDFIAQDTNNSYDVFMRDRAAGTTTRVSLSASGGEISQDSRHAVISSDGRFVAFETDSPDAVTPDTNNMLDIFVRDLDLSTTERVSLTDSGGEVNGNNYDTALSQGASYVAFTSEGTNLTPGISGNANNVFARGPLRETPGLLAFTTGPAGASAGNAFTTQPVVEVRNLDGSRKWDFNGPVTLALKAGAGRPDAVLSGTTTVNAVHGTATFSGLSIDKAGTGYVLTASTGTLDVGDSAPFDVLQTPTKVVVTTQPGGAAAGLPFTTQPQIEVRDAEDNLVPWYTGTASIAIKPGTGRGGATLSGTLTVPITNGAAAFTDLALDKAGTGYVLVVSAGALTPGETAAFSVAQTPTHLAFSVSPAGASAGLAFSTQPVVQVLDAENNVALNFSGPVTVSVKAGTGRTGAVLSGTTTVNAVAGVATFSGLSLDLAGTGYVLTAASGALTPGESAPFAVAQTPTKLAIAVQPAGAAAGIAFTTQPVIVVHDAEDNLVPAFSGPVTISIKAGTGRLGAVLSGTTTVIAVNGVATFQNLAIDKAGTGYVLTASSGTLAAADSAAFTVAQVPTHLVFVVQPAGALAGLPFTAQPAVQVRDAEENTVTAYTGPVTLALKAGTGAPAAVLSGVTTLNAVAGVATFSGLSIDWPAPGYVLTAASGALPLADSSAFAVTPVPFTLASVGKALRWAGGFTVAAPLDVAIHDVGRNGAIETVDAASIARKVSGLEPNP